MKKYVQESFNVVNRNTGAKICECGEENDALMMVSFDPQKRTYTRNQMLMGEIIDVEIPKALPTNEVVRSVVQPEPLKLKEDKREPVAI